MSSFPVWVGVGVLNSFYIKTRDKVGKTFSCDAFQLLGLQWTKFVSVAIHAHKREF